MSAVRADVQAFADELYRAESTGVAIDLASRRFGDLDWNLAREIALARDELHASDGDALIGYKLGWTSAPMREALGIDRPNWGTLWQSQQLTGPLEMRPLRHAKAEPEIVYVADRDLKGPTMSAGDVLDAAAGWAVGIEIVHPRWPSFDFTWLDNTADNSSAHAICVGDTVSVDIDPADIEVRFTNGLEERRGLGNQALESPAEAVAWLVRSLASSGVVLRAGQIVFTGGLTAPFDVDGPTRLLATSDDLGSVALHTDEPRFDAPKGT